MGSSCSEVRGNDPEAGVFVRAITMGGEPVDESTRVLGAEVCEREEKSDPANKESLKARL